MTEYQRIFTGMSAIMRAIDLVTLTVAPILTGQIMTYASTRTGALFIGGWNLVSVFVEYYLLWKVYDIVPALKAKRYKRRADKGKFPVSILRKAISGRHRAVRVADGPMTARCRFT